MKPGHRLPRPLTEEQSSHAEDGDTANCFADHRNSEADGKPVGERYEYLEG